MFIWHLQYFYTGVTSEISFPEFSVVGLVDGEQFVYCDSNIRKKIPKAEWMEKSVGEDYWTRETQKAQGAQETFIASVGAIMRRFSQTEGVHTWQRIFDCELHEDRTKTGYHQEGYDGEDFIGLDLNIGTWTADGDKAGTSKLKWEENKGAAHVKACLANECNHWLERYVEYGRSTLERKVPPEASLFQKDSSSPVACHATGFFPEAVMISWQENGEDLPEDVELRETLPNQDGTFQKRRVLTVSPEELTRHDYTCIFQHSSLEEEMVLQVSDNGVLSCRRNLHLHLKGK
ncbi:hypothetical protein AOLI_G00275750 [Acnodon oligacanthus]